MYKHKDQCNDMLALPCCCAAHILGGADLLTNGASSFVCGSDPLPGEFHVSSPGIMHIKMVSHDSKTTRPMPRRWAPVFRQTCHTWGLFRGPGAVGLPRAQQDKPTGVCTKGQSEDQ